MKVGETRRVSYSNIQDVATWCRGEIGKSYEPLSEGQTYIQVDVDNHPHTEHWRAYIGCWIKWNGLFFVVYTDEEWLVYLRTAKENPKFLPILALVKEAMQQQEAVTFGTSDVDLIQVAEQATFKIMDL